VARRHGRITHSDGLREFRLAVLIDRGHRELPIRPQIPRKICRPPAAKGNGPASRNRYEAATQSGGEGDDDRRDPFWGRSLPTLQASGSLSECTSVQFTGAIDSTLRQSGATTGWYPGSPNMTTR